MSIRNCASVECVATNVLRQCRNDIGCIANTCRELGAGVRCAHLAFAQIDRCMSFYPSISDIVYCARENGHSIDLIRSMLDAMPVRSRRTCDYAYLGITTAQLGGESYPALAIINQESPSSRLFNLLYSLYDHRIHVELGLYPIRLYPNAMRGTLIITAEPIHTNDIPTLLNALDRDRVQLYTSVLSGNVDALYALLRGGLVHFLVPQAIPIVRDLLTKYGGVEDADYAYDGIEPAEEEDELVKLVGNIVNATNTVIDEMVRRCGEW